MTIARINGIDVYYEEHGPPDGEPVLLIMGFLMNAAAWAPQIPALAERYRVIAFDNRGAGRTSAPLDAYTMEQMADDAAGVLDVAGAASAHVVGASMGGMIAQHVALRYPERVRSLVLMCTSPGGPRSFGYGEWTKARAEAGDQQPDQLGEWTPERARDYALLLFTPEFLAAPGPGFAQMVGAIMQYPTPPHAMLAQGEAILLHDTYDRLPEIAASTLVMTGADDTLVDAHNSNILAERIPGAELRVLPGLRHGFNAQAPDEVNAILLEFLGRHATVAAGGGRA